MRIVHQSALDSYCQPPNAKVLLLSPPRVAGLLPANTTSNDSVDHRVQVQTAAVPLLETAVQFLDGQTNEAAVLAAFAGFFNQIIKSAPNDRPAPKPLCRTREEMDAEIAEMVAASRERIQRRQQEIRDELRNRRFFS